MRGPLSEYQEKLLDPRWQKRRLGIFERDAWKCRVCAATHTTLHVHHLWYVGEPWEAPDEALVTLCSDCHDAETDRRPLEEQRLLRAMRRGAYGSHALGLLADAFEQHNAHPRIKGDRPIEFEEAHSAAYILSLLVSDAKSFGSFIRVALGHPPFEGIPAPTAADLYVRQVEAS